MTNEMQTTEQTLEQKSEEQTIAFGPTLKAARESMGMDLKDVAARLRLNENIIIMMEKDRYPADIPPTFIRGYIRSYGKLLQLPDHEISKAIEPIATKKTPPPQAPVTIQQMPLTSSNKIVRFVTLAMGLIILGLAGAWWHSHSNANKEERPLGLQTVVQTTATETTKSESAEAAISEPKAIESETNATAPQVAAESTDKATKPDNNKTKPAEQTTKPAAAGVADKVYEYDNDTYDEADDDIYLD